MLIAIAAMTSDHLIGKNNTLPRELPADLKRFKELTTGNTVIMWRKTYESLPEAFRPLPNRHNIVISSQKNYHLSTEKENTSVEVIHDINKILELKNWKIEKIFIIWWGKIYTTLLPYCDQLIITEVKWNYKWDTYFPEFKNNFIEISREAHETHDFVTYTRK